MKKNDFGCRKNPEKHRELNTEKSSSKLCAESEEKEISDPNL
jgi:hypothetical protein